MEISNTYFGESLKLVKKGEGKMIKKKHSQDKRDKNISALQVCTEILPIRSKKKKTIQNTIGKRNWQVDHLDKCLALGLKSRSKKIIF